MKAVVPVATAPEPVARACSWRLTGTSPAALAAQAG